MQNKIEQAKETLIALRNILENEGETNWSRGVKTALTHIEAGTEEEYLLAKSVYKTMCHGGRGFMEYYIKETGTSKNDVLDNARDKLFDIFEI